MRTHLETDRTEYQHALERVAQEEVQLLQQLTAVRAQGQQLQGAIAALDKLLAALPEAPPALPPEDDADV